MVAGPVLVIERSACGFTVRVAVAATELGPMLVVSAPAGIVFTSDAPADADVTSIVSVHVPFAGTVPPASVTLEAVLDGAPPAHVVARFGVAAVTRPPGKVSVTDVTVIGAPLLLPIVIVSVDVPPGLIALGAKALAIVGETEVTVSVAVLDTAPVAACVLDTPEAVFGFAPTAVPRTTTVTVHERLAGIDRPVNESA